MGQAIVSQNIGAAGHPSEPRQAVLEGLREQIRKIEQAAILLDTQSERSGEEEKRGRPAASSSAWTLGAPEIDVLLGPDGLEIAGVHEIKPVIPETGNSRAGGTAAAFAFALRLAARRAAQADVNQRKPALILCCRPAVAANELGQLYGPGLRALGLDPDRFLFAEPAKDAEVLWVLEEGLKSQSLALVLGSIEDVALTPARRLALAAAAHRTPCLLLTHPRSEGTAATVTRWRVGPHPSTPHVFDERAPGIPRIALRLERSRSRPVPAGALSFAVEWCDETHSFRVAAHMADRSDAPRRPVRSAR